MPSRLHAKIGTLRQLEILLAVYRHRSVTEAAESLHLTQPTVSAQLKKLTDAIGMPIYFPLGKTLQFTEAGEQVVKSAREVMDSFSRLDMQLTNMRGLTAGTLKLSVVTTAQYFAPHLIADFCRLYPHIDVHFTVGNRQQIVDRMEQGEDDFCIFSHPPQHEGYQLVEFLPNRLVAIAPTNHPLSQQSKVSWKEFCQAPFLMRERGSGTRHAIEEHLKQRSSQPNVRMTIESNEAIKHSVMSGLGVSILSEHTLTFGGQSGLSVLHIDQLPIVTNWYLVRIKNKPVTPIADALLTFVKQMDRQTLLADIE